jgi:hypothetical protein
VASGRLDRDFRASDQTKFGCTLKQTLHFRFRACLDVTHHHGCTSDMTPYLQEYKTVIAVLVEMRLSMLSNKKYQARPINKFRP